MTHSPGCHWRCGVRAIEDVRPEACPGLRAAKPGAQLRSVNLGQNGKFVGYITLVCGEVVIQEGDEPPINDQEVSYLYRQYPAIKIARLAVDRRVRGSGIGVALVNLALGIARDFICPNVGCRFVMVDSKRQSVRFYERRGFTVLDTKENRERQEPVMFVDLSKV